MSIAAELVLYNGCLIGIPIRDFAWAAGQAGFDAVTIWPRTYHRAISREGLTPPGIKRILDDAGVRCVEIEGYDGWLARSAQNSSPFQCPWDRSQFFDAAAELGADTISVAATDASPVPHQSAVDGFAAVCSQAAAYGLRVSLEFVAFGAISNITSGWKIIRDAGQPNGGLTIDIHHLRRGGSDKDQPLPAIPANAVFDVQLCDGPRAAPPDLTDEAMYRRTLPGTGEFDVQNLLSALEGQHVRTRVGPELYAPEFAAQPALRTATRLFDATERALGGRTLSDVKGMG